MIQDNNRIENNTQYGLYVTTTSPFDVTDNNTFKNNSVAGIYLGAGTNVTIRDNNTIADNGQYGIWINGSAVIADGQVWWNDIRGNGDYGIYVDAEPVSGYFHAECNWWDHSTGPLDNSTGEPDYNPLGQGQNVSDYFRYRQRPPDPTPRLYWLVEPSKSASSCYNEP